jgi:cytochrome b involved in lipid metabolism
MPPIQPDTREAVVNNSAAALASDVQGTPQRAYTWEEVARHNTAEKALVIIDGLVYDITGFMDRHPGGREMMLLSAGRECTDLFRMYHWWDEAKTPRSIMAKFQVGWLEGPTEFPVYASDSRGFYSVLSKRVRQHFEKAYPADPKGATKHPWPALWRLAIMFAVAALCYCTVHGLLLPGLPLPAKLAVAALAGVFQAMPLMHAMHDACHTAMGASEAWWKVFGRLCLDWYAGGCMITWHHQHVIGHHVYTNVFKSDPDLPAV